MAKILSERIGDLQNHIRGNHPHLLGPAHNQTLAECVELARSIEGGIVPDAVEAIIKQPEPDMSLYVAREEYNQLAALKIALEDANADLQNELAEYRNPSGTMHDEDDADLGSD